MLTFGCANTDTASGSFQNGEQYDARLLLKEKSIAPMRLSRLKRHEDRREPEAVQDYFLKTRTGPQTLKTACSLAELMCRPELGYANDC
jgi:tRNA uridine 5-carboxymethylaminomethyl modification enzyme